MKKIVLIVLICGVAITGLSIWKVRSSETELTHGAITETGVETNNDAISTKYFKTKEECERQTKKTCTGPQFCDYKCDKDFFKGAWVAQD